MKSIKNKIIPIMVAISAIIILVIAIDKKANETTVELVNPNELVVFVDAGHGGKDDGASWKGRNEKDDNLNIALAVKEELESSGVTVIMTRETDEKLSLSQLTEKANKSGADLFVALHRNSSESDIGGVEIWVEKTKPKNDTLLATNILEELDKVGITNNRGVRFGLAGDSKSDYYVNKHTDMPSCLIELGFITCEDDNKMFDKNLKNYSKAIANGIIKTANELNKV